MQRPFKRQFYNGRSQGKVNTEYLILHNII